MAGLKAWYDGWIARRAQKFLAQHPVHALQVLRADPQLAAGTMRHFLEMEAVKGAPQRDTSAYPVLGPFGYGSTAPLQQTLPKPTPANIRRFSETPPARRAMTAIRDPLLDFPFAIEQVKPIGKYAHARQPEVTEEQHERIVAITRMLSQPNNDCTWREFLSQVVEDLLIFGAGVFEVQDNRSDERPYFLWPVDAQSIRINAGWKEGSATPRYSQGRGYFAGTLGSPDLIRLQNDELCYMRLNPRSNTPFGLGYCEVAFGIINAFIGSFEYAERRASNNTPNFGIFLGDNVTIDQARAWQHYWRSEIEGYGAVPIIGGGKQPSVFNMSGTGEDQLFIRWIEFTVRVIAMSFGVSAFRLGLERDVNRSTASASQESDWATVAPVANLVRDYLTHWLLWYRLGRYDLEFVWKTRTTDELKQAQILAEQWDSDAITVNEIRVIYERPPLDEGLGDLTKTAYMAAIKAATTPQKPGVPGEEVGNSGGMPFDLEEEFDQLSPGETAFVRALVKAQRHGREQVVHE